MKVSSLPISDQPAVIRLNKTRQRSLAHEANEFNPLPGLCKNIADAIGTDDLPVYCTDSFC